MVIVESQKQYLELCELLSQDFILIPVFYNHKTHPSIIKISLLYFHFIDKNLSYLLPFDHPDCIDKLGIDYDFTTEIFIKIMSSNARKFVIDKRDFEHYLNNELDLLDIQMLDYIDNGKSTIDFEEYTPAHKFIYRKFYKRQETNLIIPVLKHIEFLEDNKNKILKAMQFSPNIGSKTYLEMNRIMLDTLYNIEVGRIKVSNGMLKKEFVFDGFAYSKYNPYTITSRPSCTYRGFNFVGMGKDDGSRKKFVSRFGEDGMLLLIDYDACHFYLMASLIGETFPEHPYMFLGKQYFNKTELTDEEYQLSKQLSFNVIYGGIPDEFMNIVFYKKIKDFIFELYHTHTNLGYIETHYFKRKIYTSSMKKITPHKLFNYYMQAMETESHMIILSELFEKINNFETKAILYIYDSILIDFKISEGKPLIDAIVNALQQNDQFPVSVSYGTNYQEMHKLS
jgi:hypothetical protein